MTAPYLFTSEIPAGFASVVDDHIERALDLNELMAPRPASTFYVRVRGDSMIQAHITTGDILVVDRSLEPQNNKIVIAVLDGEFTVKRLVLQEGRVYLKAENDRFPLLEITKGRDFMIWGVVTYVIHPTT